MTTETHYWFGRKRFGIGFGPRSWQGWLTVLVYAVLMMTLPSFIGPSLGNNGAGIVCIGLTVAFFGVFFWKLERPGSH
jgi:hypothetical protein